MPAFLCLFTDSLVVQVMAYISCIVFAVEQLHMCTNSMGKL